MTDMIRAPWTPEQVAALNEFQRRGGMHPFTCGGEHTPGSPILVAREDGWHCSDPYGEGCDYRQDWANAFMADPSTWPKPFADLRQATATGACIHPDGYDGECPCPPSCGCCKVAPAVEPLRARIAEAIESEVYEYRELMCQWGETDGTTQEIARRATNAVMAVVDPSPPPLNLPRETVATLHDMLGRLLASNPAGDLRWPLQKAGE